MSWHVWAGGLHIRVEWEDREHPDAPYIRSLLYHLPDGDEACCGDCRRRAGVRLADLAQKEHPLISFEDSQTLKPVQANVVPGVPLEDMTRRLSNGDDPDNDALPWAYSFDYHHPTVVDRLPAPAAPPGEYDDPYWAS